MQLSKQFAQASESTRRKLDELRREGERKVSSLAKARDAAMTVLLEAPMPTPENRLRAGLADEVDDLADQLAAMQPLIMQFNARRPSEMSPTATSSDGPQHSTGKKRKAGYQDEGSQSPETQFMPLEPDVGERINNLEHYLQQQSEEQRGIIRDCAQQICTNVTLQITDIPLDARDRMSQCDSDAAYLDDQMSNMSKAHASRSYGEQVLEQLLENDAIKARIDEVRMSMSLYTDRL